MLLKIKRRDFFSTRQHSYFGVTHCEISEVRIAVFSLSVLREEMKEYNFYVDQLELLILNRFYAIWAGLFEAGLR